MDRLVRKLTKHFVFGAGLALLVSCAGPARITILSGSCEAVFERCMKHCSKMTEAYDCELRCRFKGKHCARAQGMGLAAGAQAKDTQIDDAASLVDFSGARVLHSRSAKLTLSKTIKRAELKKKGKTSEYLRTLPPGATAQIEYALPAHADQAELVLRHGPAGKFPQCFLTIMLDEQTLVGRYSPPRSKEGRVILEKWDLTKMLRKTKLVDGKRSFKLLILNNQAAGSRDDYRLSSVELYYQVRK